MEAALGHLSKKGAGRLPWPAPLVEFFTKAKGSRKYSRALWLYIHTYIHKLAAKNNFLSGGIVFMRPEMLTGGPKDAFRYFIVVRIVFCGP